MANNIWRWGTAAALLWLSAICVVVAAPTNQTKTDKAWALVFEDNFDGYGRPDTNKWNFDYGYIANNELQWYVDWDWIVVRNNSGTLQIRPQLTYDPSHWCGWRQCSFLSARIKTQYKFALMHGRIVARVKSPSGRGMWPAFWALGSNIDSVGWPKCGEIDIFEHDGSRWNFNSECVHGMNYGGTNFYLCHNTETYTVLENFHEYMVEWDTLGLRWYIDNNQVAERTRADFERYGPWPFDQPMFIILNLALGGDFVGNPQPSEIEYAGRIMEIDWVRVYQWY